MVFRWSMQGVVLPNGGFHFGNHHFAGFHFRDHPEEGWFFNPSHREGFPIKTTLLDILTFELISQGGLHI